VLGVDGARQAGVPIVVVAGDRTYAVFALESTDGSGPPTISVGSDERWLLAGVAGSTGSAADLAERLSAGGAGDLVAELVGSAMGASTVTWKG